MRAQFHTRSVVFVREEGDPKFYGNLYAKGEHTLFRHVARFLNAHGFDVVKKRAQKDGHMIGDGYQPYIRTRKPGSGPAIYLWSPFYALRGANEDWNKKGCVTLTLEVDVFGHYGSLAQIHKLCEGDLALEWAA